MYNFLDSKLLADVDVFPDVVALVFNLNGSNYVIDHNSQQMKVDA
jgi:hypothetical protein